MSKAPAIYCRGRADEVRGDEATYLSMTVRHGHSRRARRPLATASLFSAALPRSSRHWRRSAPLCRQHPVLACQHGMIGRC